MAPTRDDEKSIPTERLSLPQIDVELAQLCIDHDLLVGHDVGHPVRDGNNPRTRWQLAKLRQQFFVEPRQQVERDDGGPFTQVEREDVSLLDRDQLLHAALTGVLA